MTSCSGQRAEVVAEEYLRGNLPEEEAQRFEEHYLKCDACFEHVRALQAVRDTFAQERTVGFLSTIARPPAWAAFAITAAAVVIFSVAVHWHFGRQSARQDAALQAPVEQKATAQEAAPSPQPEPTKPAPVELASIADRSLPPFREIQLRGASEDEHFQSGMHAYVAGDCAAASSELKRVPKTSNWGDAALFYSGVCEYQLRRSDSARQSLAGLASNPESPFSETARYYLAQVELQQNHSADAQRWLKQVVALHGDYEARALKQLQKINNLE